MTKPKYHNKHTYPLPKEKGRSKPKIPIRLINYDTGVSRKINALIDTGSDYCVIPSYITKSIGFKLTEEDKIEKGLKGISGKRIDTYVHGFKIEILDADMKNVVCRLDTHAYTVKTENLTPILGTHGFLKNFNLSIDYKKNTITLMW
ncbi:hypothetical protein [uncultured Croceitalea sp.]|uniref:hypothetical protein n=1 Tax=uncultured Croceitalea sp. TaxID=1798908 RepID=UPI00330633CA